MKESTTKEQIKDEPSEGNKAAGTQRPKRRRSKVEPEAATESPEPSTSEDAKSKKEVRPKESK